MFKKAIALLLLLVLVSSPFLLAGTIQYYAEQRNPIYTMGFSKTKYGQLGDGGDPTYEDFTTYTEVDPNSDITITSSNITWSTMRRDVDAKVYKDYGVGAFGDFEHEIELYPATDIADGVAAPWVVSNSITTGNDIWNNNVHGLMVMESWNSARTTIYIRDGETGNTDSSLSLLYFNTLYYLTINRTGTTATLNVYSDSGRTNLLDTMTITCTTDTYRYIYPIMSYNVTGGGSITSSGYVQNLNLNFPPPVNSPPTFGTPNPTNNSNNQLLSLTWNISINDSEGDVFNWTIQCSNGQSSSANSESNGTKLLLLSSLSYSTEYTVWVNATDLGSGLWTREWFNFTTESNHPPNVPSVPLCENTTNPTHVLDHHPQFNWTFSDPDTGDVQAGYNIQIGTDTDWDNGAEIINLTCAQGCEEKGNQYTFYTGSSLVDGATYYWRIRTRDNSGNWGDFTSTQSFRMNSIPSAPLLSSPANNSIQMPFTTNSINLSWSASSDSEGDSLNYWYQYAKDMGFTVSLVESWTGGPVYKLIPSAGELERGVEYYWRVKAWDGLEWGRYSGWRQFETDNGLNISVQPSSLGFGIIFVGQTNCTTGGYFNITNNGVAANIDISCSDTQNFTFVNYGARGLNNFCINWSDNNWSTEHNVLVGGSLIKANLLESNSFLFDIRLLMPLTVTTITDGESFQITFTATPS